MNSFEALFQAFTNPVKVARPAGWPKEQGIVWNQRLAEWILIDTPGRKTVEMPSPRDLFGFWEVVERSEVL